MCTYDIDIYSVADKMVRNLFLEVRDNQGTLFQVYDGNPGIIQ